MLQHKFSIVFAAIYMLTNLFQRVRLLDVRAMSASNLLQQADGLRCFGFGALDRSRLLDDIAKHLFPCPAADS